jgi:hypothetical protein
MEDRIKAMEWLSEKDLVIENKNIGKRNLYELDIPEPEKRNTPTWKNYLDEEGKLTDKDLNKFREIFKNSWESDLLEKFDDFWVKMLDYYWQNWKWLYKFLNRALWSDKQASKFLESLGYDGIHYFWGQDWESYVLFKDESPQIKNTIRYKHKLLPKQWAERWVKEVWRWVFWTIYEWIKDAEAENFLKEMKTWEVKWAYHYTTKDGEDISINAFWWTSWYDKEFWIAKLASKHPEALWNIQKRLNRAEKDNVSPNRIEIFWKWFYILLARDWKWNPKDWVLTAYEPKK